MTGSGERAGLTNAETQLSVGVGNPSVLLVENRLGPLYVPQCELLSHVDVIGFCECQTGDLLPLAPYTLEVIESVSRDDRPPERVEVGGFQRYAGSRRHTAQKRFLETVR